MKFLGLSLLLISVIVNNQCYGKSHTSNLKEKERELKLLERIEEILAEKKIEESTTQQQARQEVAKALERGALRLQKLKERQKLKRQQGVDGKLKKGRSRLFKSTAQSRRRQYNAFRLLSAKKELSKITGKTLQDLAKDENYVVAWEEATRKTETERRLRYRVKRAVDCDGVDNVNQYRTMGGTCNNLVNTDWGSAGAQAPRFLPEVYNDSISEPRAGQDNMELPGPRDLSNAFFGFPGTQDNADLEGFNTLMSMFWGQFLDHDIVLTPTMTGDDGASITCCENGEPVDREECMAMALTPENDLDSLTCMEFTRSQDAVDTTLGEGKQLVNEITSFIDASMVYGSSEDELQALRGDGGKMLVNEASNGDMLPEDSSDDAVCTLDGKDSEDYCQKAGDVRVNVQPGLGLMHLLFLREHNRIVDELKSVGWTDDEQIFNEARKIVGAEIQHITYNEYFNNVFTDGTIEKYGLTLLESGQSTNYDQSCNPGITVGFSTAAFRFGHSQIPHQLAYMKNLSDPTNLSSVTAMDKLLKNPHMLINKAGKKIVDLVQYSTATQASKADSQFNDAIRNKLFSEPLDLTSLNINRGRDHGLPTYLQWRQWCGLSVPSSDTAFRELDDIPGTNRRTLLDIYGNLTHIDLYVGGMLERRLSGDGSYVGPTFACILGQQFKQLKECDRFWYERPAPEGFSLDQLTEIRKVTLAGVICDNASDDPSLLNIQRRALLSSTNRRSCEINTNNPDRSQISRINFSAWSNAEK